MTTAYPKKLRFVDDPIAASLIPDHCRDDYGVDALALVKHLEWYIGQLAAELAHTRIDRDNMQKAIMGVPCDGC